jgi:hypothetical protein
MLKEATSAEEIQNVVEKTLEKQRKALQKSQSLSKIKFLTNIYTAKLVDVMKAIPLSEIPQ